MSVRYVELRKHVTIRSSQEGVVVRRVITIYRDPPGSIRRRWAAIPLSRWHKTKGSLAHEISAAKRTNAELRKRVAKAEAVVVVAYGAVPLLPLVGCELDEFDNAPYEASSVLARLEGALTQFEGA